MLKSALFLSMASIDGEAILEAIGLLTPMNVPKNAMKSEIVKATPL
jgi:hypothetical protein